MNISALAIIALLLGLGRCATVPSNDIDDQVINMLKDMIDKKIFTRLPVETRDQIQAQFDDATHAQQANEDGQTGPHKPDSNSRMARYARPLPQLHPHIPQPSSASDSVGLLPQTLRNPNNQDLACSACVFSANIVIDTLMELRKRNKAGIDFSKLQPEILRKCSAVSRMAVVGKVGSREYISFEAAMNRETRGSSTTNLKNVAFMPEHTRNLQDACKTYGLAYTSGENMKLVPNLLKTKRTISDLGVLQSLCGGREDQSDSVTKIISPVCSLNTVKPHGSLHSVKSSVESSMSRLERIKASKILAKEDTKVQRKQRYVSQRPFLVGRYPVAEAGSFCEMCHLLTEEVNFELALQVAQASAQVDMGMRKDQSFDLGLVLQNICDPTANKRYSHYSLRFRVFCDKHVRGRENVVATFAKEFSGSPPSAAMAFTRKDNICGTLEPQCKVIQKAGKFPKPSRCEACRIAVRDTFMSLRQFSGRRDFLSNGHIEEVLETVCEIIDMRHPPEIARVARPLCEDILDEFDNELIDVFSSPAFFKEAGGGLSVSSARLLLEREVCGSLLAKVCDDSVLHTEL